MGNKQFVYDGSIWKTLKHCNDYETAENIIKAIEEVGGKVDDRIKSILKEKTVFIAADRKEKIDLVLVSVETLGFSGGASLEKIYKQAQKLGLSLFSPELALLLRSQYMYQLKGTGLIVAVEPLTDPDGSKGVFILQNTVGNIPTLDMYYGRFGYYDSMDCFVFCVSA